MKHAKLISDYKSANGIWPDVLYADPTCLHHIAFELGVLASLQPGMTSIRIMHSNLIGSGMALCCTLEQMIEFEQDLLDVNSPEYVPIFHPEACN